MKEGTLFLQLFNFNLKKTMKPDCSLLVEMFLIIPYIVIDLMCAVPVLASLIMAEVGRPGGALDEIKWPLPTDCRFLRLRSDYLIYYFTLGFLGTKGRNPT